MNPAVLLALIGVILLGVGAGMTAGLLPQSTSISPTGSGCALASTFAICPGLLASFNVSILAIPFTTAVLVDHSVVGKVNVTALTVNWGDGTNASSYGTRVGFTASHAYPLRPANYTIVEKVVGTFSYSLSSSASPAINPTPRPQLVMTVTATASKVVLIDGGAPSGGSTGGCGTQCPVLVANFTVSASGLNATFVDRSVSTNMCQFFNAPAGNVSWGDGASGRLLVGGAITHTYSAPGTYTVRESLSGQYPQPGSLCLPGLANGGTLYSNASAPITVGAGFSTSVTTFTTPAAASAGLTPVSGAFLGFGVGLLAASVLVAAGRYGFAAVAAVGLGALGIGLGVLY